MKISQNFVAFSEYINFNCQCSAVDGFAKYFGFKIVLIFWPDILLCRTQTTCFARSKCFLSHMLLTLDAAWLGTWQVGRAVVSILKWVGTVFQMNRTNRDHPFTTLTNFYDF